MALKYKVKKKVFGFDDTKTERYVAMPVLNGTIGYEKLCAEVNARTGAHRGQVSIIIGGMLDVMASFMEEGMSIKLGELGSIRPAFNAKSALSADGVSSDNVVRRKFIFTPGKLLKNTASNLSLQKIKPDGSAEDDGEPETPENPGGTGGDGGDDGSLE